MADLTNPNQSLKDILGILQGMQGIEDGYTRPDYVDVIDPSVRDVNTLQDQLGVTFTYDPDEIRGIYEDATKASYNAQELQQRQAEKGYYGNMAKAQDSLTDAMRGQRGEAIATGASKGMQAANMLSAALGMSNNSAAEATQLAQDRQLMGQQHGAQLKQDAKDSTAYANEMANTIAGISRQLYNDDIQRETAELSYNQGINTDYAGYYANKYTSDSNLAGQLASAGAGIYNNNQSAIAAIQAAIEERKGTQYAADKGQNQNINYSGGYSVR